MFRESDQFVVICDQYRGFRLGKGHVEAIVGRVVEALREFQGALRQRSGWREPIE